MCRMATPIHAVAGVPFLVRMVDAEVDLGPAAEQMAVRIRGRNASTFTDYPINGKLVHEQHEQQE